MITQTFIIFLAIIIILFSLGIKLRNEQFWGVICITFALIFMAFLTFETFRSGLQEFHHTETITKETYQYGVNSSLTEKDVNATSINYYQDNPVISKYTLGGISLLLFLMMLAIGIILAAKAQENKEMTS